MSIDALQVASLTSQVERYLGHRVRVQGYFVLAEGDGYLVSSPESRANTNEAIRIDVPDLKQRALATIPPLGGGKYYYLHQATVDGKVAPRTSDLYACALVEVTEFEAWLSGECFSIQLGRAAPDV